MSRSYVQQELDAIQAEKQAYPIRIKIQSDSGETRWLNVTLEQFTVIERLLTTVKEDTP